MVDERFEIAHLCRSRRGDEFDFRAPGVMDQRVETLARLQVSATAGNVLEPQFVKRGVLRQRRAFEMDEVVLIQLDAREHFSGRDQIAPKNQRGSGKLT